MSRAEQPLSTIRPQWKRSLMVWFPEGKGALFWSFVLAFPLTYVVCSVTPFEWDRLVRSTVARRFELEAGVAYVLFLVCWAGLFWLLDQARKARLPRAELYADRLELRGLLGRGGATSCTVPLAEVGHIGLNGEKEFLVDFGTAARPSRGPLRIPLAAMAAEDQFEAFHSSFAAANPDGLYSTTELEDVSVSRPWHLDELFPDAVATRTVVVRHPDVASELVDVQVGARAFVYDGRSGGLCGPPQNDGELIGPAVLRFRRDFATCPRGVVFTRIVRDLDWSFALRVDAAHRLDFRWSERAVFDAAGERIGTFEIEPESTTVEFERDVPDVVAILGALFLGNRHIVLRVPCEQVAAAPDEEPTVVLERVAEAGDEVVATRSASEAQV